MNSPHFTEATASFVGPRYEKETVPRLLFLSLDSGSGRSDPELRTAEAVRARELATDVHALPKGRHWRRTHELARVLLRQFKPDLTLPETRLYFAHVNSAKCSQNKSQRRQADRRLFKNCRRFIPGELRVLGPDVIVTQGGWARAAVLEGFDVQQHVVRKDPVTGYRRAAHYETGLIGLEPRRNTLWLHTYHPNSYGHFNPQRVHCWPPYAERLGRFWRSRPRR